MRTVPKPKNSAGRNLPVAIGVGVGLGALVVFAVWAGQLAWYIVVAVAVGVAMWEVLTRLREHSYHLPRTLMIIGGQAMLWSSWPFETNGLIAVYVVAVLALMFGRLFHNGRHRPPINYLRDMSVGVFVLTWIPMFGSFAAMLSTTSQGGASIIVFMLCVVASDTGGYVAGVMFGSHPMAPAVSVRIPGRPRGVSVQAGTRHQRYVQYSAGPRRPDGPPGWHVAGSHGHVGGYFFPRCLIWRRSSSMRQPPISAITSAPPMANSKNAIPAGNSPDHAKILSSTDC